MKIHVNPNFPLLPGPVSETRPPEGLTDTLQFIQDLESRNALALTRLKDGLRPKEPASKHHIQATGSQTRRFSGVTGPPIDAPGGHVHLIEGTIAFIE